MRIALMLLLMFLIFIYSRLNIFKDKGNDENQ